MSSNLTPFIFPHRQFPRYERTLVAGLPFFPSELGGAGENVKIIRCWQTEPLDNYSKELTKRIFIRFQPPEYRVYEKCFPNISFNNIQILYQHRPDLEVMWLGQIGAVTYMILEETPFDLDDEIFTQYIVRLNNPNSISIIGTTELLKMIPIIKNHVNSYPIPTDLSHYLGSIHSQQSLEYYTECISERAISRIFKIRWDIVSAGKSVPISKWQHPLPENLSISLFIPSDPNLTEEFFVKEYLELNDRHYLIIQPERTLISSEKWEAYLVRLEGNSIFSLDSESEFQQIARVFIDRLENNSRGNNFHPLGSISAKEVDFLLDYLSTNMFASNSLLINSDSKLYLTNSSGLTNLVLVKHLNNLSSSLSEQPTFIVAKLGKPLTIKHRWRISSYLYLSLSFPDQSNIKTYIPKTLDFSTLFVECIFYYNFWYYIVLQAPSNLSDKNNTPHFLLKIQDSNTLITLTDDELSQVMPIYQSSKSKTLASNIVELLKLLNSLPISKAVTRTTTVETKALTTKPLSVISSAEPNIIANYNIIETIAKSPLATTYLAEQTSLGNRKVLLKVFDSIQPDLENLFLQEVEIYSKLDHQNIPKLYQGGKTADKYFYSIEYINTVPLNTIKTANRITPMQILLIIEQVANALAYAHEKNIIHSDIKLDDILISNTKQVFLTGFTKPTKKFVNSAIYASAEQLLEQPLTAYTDIYILGLITYELFTSHLPFEGNTLEDILHKKLTNQITSVQSFNNQLPKSLDKVFQKALSGDPKTSYQDIQDFIKDLKASFSELIKLTPVLSEISIIESTSRESKNYLGLSASNFFIEDLLGEGVFSWVYRGIEPVNLTQKAFKIAKPRELVISLDHSANKTQKIEFTLGSIISTTPDVYKFLNFQAQKLQKVSDIALVKADNLTHNKDICYYQMEYVVGQTLRQLMKTGVPIRVMIDIAYALDRLLQNPDFRYHGDLKPENIIITTTGIKLIDPGYFSSAEKSSDQQIITTPSYYPALEPDDLLAFGLILWEVAFGENPLAEKLGSSEFIDLGNIGENLFKWVYESELKGNYFKSAILNICQPIDIKPNIAPQLGEFLFNALNLYIRNDNKIDRKIYFKNFRQIIVALESLIETGILYL